MLGQCIPEGRREYLDIYELFTDVYYPACCFCVGPAHVAPLLPLQTMTCALAPPASNSALTISAGWCAPVTRVTGTTASATGAGRLPTVWVSGAFSVFISYCVYSSNLL